MDDDDHELPVVAFLGPKASYTHQAATQHFSATHHNLHPQTTIEDVFNAVQSGRAASGVVPFENSSNGSVVFTLDLLADLSGRHPDIRVAGEIYLPVRHCLVGRIPADQAQHHHHHQSQPHPSKTDRPWRKLRIDEGQLAPDSLPGNMSGQITPTQAAPRPSVPRACPAADLRHIAKLYTHPQAWGQCKLFLGTYVKSAERVDVSSTSKAAEYVAQEDGSAATSAAISSRLAAELNGLDVLAEGIEDVEGNSTRFFVLRRECGRLMQPQLHSHPVDGVEHLAAEAGGMENGRYKTLVAFTVSHGEAGALADSLAVFKKYALNLTSINTRPSGEAVWHYIFFVEVRGAKGAEGEGGTVNMALEELSQVARSSRWLGSWESASKE